MKKLSLAFALPVLVALASPAHPLVVSSGGCIYQLHVRLQDDRTRAHVYLGRKVGGAWKLDYGVYFGKNKIYLLGVSDGWKVTAGEPAASTPEEWAKWGKAWELMKLAAEAKAYLSLHWDKTNNEVVGIYAQLQSPCT